MGVGALTGESYACKETPYVAYWRRDAGDEAGASFRSRENFWRTPVGQLVGTCFRLPMGDLRVPTGRCTGVRMLAVNTARLPGLLARSLAAALEVGLSIAGRIIAT